MQVLKLKDKNVLLRLNRVLDEGGIAAIPTDTVYGLVTKSAADSIKNLARLKGRRNMAFAAFASDAGKIGRYAKVSNHTQKKIIENLLPGKLTLIFKEKKKQVFGFDGKVGIRVPDSEWLLRFLNDYGKPLISTSANLHNDPPLRSSKRIRENFPGLELIIDGGDLDSRPSTVLDVSHYPPSVRRLGTVPIYEIDKVINRKVKIDKEAYFSVLVVCTGNSCRSPMAVGILKNILRGLPIFVYSAGTIADLGFPAAQNAIIAVREKGIDISRHQSQPLSRELIIRSDMVLAMQHKHRERIIEFDPSSISKTFLIKNFPDGTEEISDPIGGNLDVYRRCLKMMLPGLKKIAKDIRVRYNG